MPKRLLLQLTLGISLSVFVLLIVFFSLDSKNLTYFYTINEILEKPKKFYGKKIRVMGLVEKGSVIWIPLELSLRFRLTEDGKQFLPVQYQGTKPDMFKEGQGVVVEGSLAPIKNTKHLKIGGFHATTLLVKHSEDYKVPDHKKNKEQYYKSLQQ